MKRHEPAVRQIEGVCARESTKFGVRAPEGRCKCARGTVCVRAREVVLQRGGLRTWAPETVCVREAFTLQRNGLTRECTVLGRADVGLGKICTPYLVHK